MNYEELIEKLRSREPLVDNRLLDEAADAIENLQQAVKAYSDLGNRMSNLNFGLIELVLQADAAVSAAEEEKKAMQEKFKQAVTELDPCLICVGYKDMSIDTECDASDCDCMNCQSKNCQSKNCQSKNCQSKNCRCKECQDMDKWELQWPEVKA